MGGPPGRRSPAVASVCTGVRKFPDGGVYEGGWVEDQMSGEGKYLYPNGDIYVGGFLAGKKHGKARALLLAPAAPAPTAAPEPPLTAACPIFRARSTTRRLRAITWESGRKGT